MTVLLNNFDSANSLLDGNDGTDEYDEENFSYKNLLKTLLIQIILTIIAKYRFQNLKNCGIPVL